MSSNANVSLLATVASKEGGARLSSAIRMAINSGRQVNRTTDQDGHEYVEFVDWKPVGDFNCEVAKPLNERRRTGRVYLTGPRANYHLWCVACDKATHMVFVSIDLDEPRAY